MKDKLRVYWKELYGSEKEDILEGFIGELNQLKTQYFSRQGAVQKDWYKDAVIYSAYVDLFNKDFQGMTDKLDYLQDLGVDCLWLLPILESPMKDAGFDIADYNRIRPDLLGPTGDESVFDTFVAAAHNRGIKLIFDIAMNHCSEEHPWFKEARQSKESAYRDWFIWADDDQGYKDARIIFKGLCDSNWEMDDVSGQFYFHRFFEIQPDLNYRNPEVLLAMTKVLVDWKVKGVDGFRADAVPYIWKEEGTICENLPGTHTVVKFFRAVLDYLAPGSLLLAEACQPPQEVVAYFGEDDECNAAYHFPVMPRIYDAMGKEDKGPIEMAMDSEFTPKIPESSQWFMFLRCHDELTLEMVTPEERATIYGQYCKDPSWDFRQGEGIAARLGELFDFDVDRILLAYSIMLTLPGTPIVYYGDEFAKANDVAFFNKVFEETGYADTRYLGRGEIDWAQAAAVLSDGATVGSQVFRGLKKMIQVRKGNSAFSRGDLEFLDLKGSDGLVNRKLLAYDRSYDQKQVRIIQNLSGSTQEVILEGSYSNQLCKSFALKDGVASLQAYEVLWLEVL